MFQLGRRHEAAEQAVVTSDVVLLDVKMRAIRMKETLLDNHQDPKQHVEWNTDHAFKEITKGYEWVKTEDNGKQTTRRMFRYLLIPDAPWMSWNSSDGGFYSAAHEGARAEKFGEYGGWR